MRDGINIEVRVNGKPLSPRTEIAHLSSAFEWGSAGDGAAQLAFAILADALQNPQAALSAYQDFKFDAIARLANDEWTLEQESIVRWFSHWARGRG